jgi:DNA-binding transcriptional LysR family regulator
MPEPPPSLDSLRCFVEAARLLNFRAAARAVSLTPAALSQRIAALERQLDVALFHRTTRSVTLSEGGLALLPAAQRTLAAASECAPAARGQAAMVERELLIGTRHELGLSWLAPMLPALRAAHPGLIAHLYFGSGPDLVLRVRSLEIDCAVSSTRLTDPKLDSVRLHAEDYVFVGQRALLTRTPLRRAADARRHVLIDSTAELPLFRYWRDAPGGIDSMRFGGILHMGTIAAIHQLALRGEGVCVLPEYFVRKDLRSGRLVEIMPRVRPLSDYFRLIFRADDPRRSLFTALGATMHSRPLR